jgi:hypothetical protein
VPVMRKWWVMHWRSLRRGGQVKFDAGCKSAKEESKRRSIGGKLRKLQHIASQISDWCEEIDIAYLSWEYSQHCVPFVNPEKWSL